jgi:hypothetical protein
MDGLNMRFLKAFFYTLVWYLFNIVYSVLDVGVNTLFGGHREETISSRCGKGKIAGKPIHTFLARIIDFIFFWEKNHCVRNIQPRLDSHSVSTLWDKFYHGDT